MDLGHVGQSHPEIAQCHDPMQPLELVRGVPPIAGVRIGPDGTQESQFVVIAKSANGHLGQASNRADPVHASLDQLTRRKSQDPSDG